MDNSSNKSYFLALSGLDGAAGMEDSEVPNLGGEQGLNSENPVQKLPDFANRPAGKLNNLKIIIVLIFSHVLF